jgi:hypothetical protein
MAIWHISSDFILRISALIYMTYLVLWGRRACRQSGSITTEIFTIPHPSSQREKEKGGDSKWRNTGGRAMARWNPACRGQ